MDTTVLNDPVLSLHREFDPQIWLDHFLEKIWLSLDHQPTLHMLWPDFSRPLVKMVLRGCTDEVCVCVVQYNLLFCVLGLYWSRSIQQECSLTWLSACLTKQVRELSPFCAHGSSAAAFE